MRAIAYYNATHLRADHSNFIFHGMEDHAIVGVDHWGKIEFVFGAFKIRDKGIEFGTNFGLVMNEFNELIVLMEYTAAGFVIFEHPTFFIVMNLVEGRVEGFVAPNFMGCYFEIFFGEFNMRTF